VTLAPGSQQVLDIVLLALASPPAATPQPAPAAPPAPVVLPRLRVEPSVSGASVTIDGTSAGLGTVEREVPAGPHDVEVRAVGYQRWSRRVQVVREGTTRLTPTLLAERRTPGWVLPVVVVGGAALLAAATLGVAYLARGTADPTQGSWDTIREP
jgi:hypothetical protein